MSETEIKRGPGRPPRAEQVQARRRRRDDFGTDGALKLHVPEDKKDKEFTYRFVNDTKGGRVQQLYQQDWDVVTTEELGGDPDPARNVSEGTQMRRVVDGGSGLSAVLMRKPKRLYEEDKGREQKTIDAIEESMRRGAPPSTQGLNGPEAYVPGGKNMIGRS